MTTTSEAPVIRRRGVIATIAVAIVLAAATTLALRLWSGEPGPAKAPYVDPAATGRLALCDHAGKAMTSGSTTDAPFVWRVVGQTAAPAQYAMAGRTATLYAFQPRTGVPSSDWSGRMLTASSTYTNPAHPMAAATAEDVDLRDFLIGYPAQDDGFVQLRLYLGAPDRPELVTSYDSLDLKISGDRWTAVGTRSISCSSGTAESLETRMHLPGTTP